MGTSKGPHLEILCLHGRNARQGQIVADGPIHVNPKLVATARACGPWLLLFAVCVAVVVLRRPDVIFNPQFWAEDGKIWFANAHNLGAWHSLFLPHSGYLQTLSRLVAAVATLFPIRHVPLVFNVAAIIVQVLPVMLLNGARGRALVPTLPARIVLSVLYIAQPYTMEVHANLTNAQWHLAASAALVLCFDGWKSRRQVASDIALVALSGLSGPFCILLLPAAGWLLYRRRDRRMMVLVVLLGAAALLQAALAIPQMGVTRAIAPLGATLAGLFRITGGQVLLAGLLGDAWVHVYLLPSWKEGLILPIMATVGSAAVFARAVRVGSDAAITFMLFAFLVFAAALVSPQISSTAQWIAWERPHTGERYSFFPVLALYVALLLLASCDGVRWVRKLAVTAMAVVLLVAVPASLKIPPQQDLGYRHYVEEYAEVEPGDVVRIPINPVGWFMELRKPVDADDPPG